MEHGQEALATVVEPTETVAAMVPIPWSTQALKDGREQGFCPGQGLLPGESEGDAAGAASHAADGASGFFRAPRAGGAHYHNANCRETEG